MKKLVILLLAIATGCSLFHAPPPMSVYFSPCFEQYKIRKALLLPLLQHGKIEKHNLTPLMSEAIQSSQKFEILTLSEKQTIEQSDTIFACQGLIPAQSLIKLAKEFNVQAVIRGRITRYQIMPNILGLKLDLISAYNGAILWSIDVLFADNDFYSDDYHSINQAVRSISPQQFLRACCYKVAQTLQK